MAIDTTITRNLGNGYVQVDVDHPKVPTRYFKVKKDKADEFCKDFKKFDTEERIFAGIKTALPILLACGIVNALCKKMGNISRYGLSIAAGIGALLATNGLVTKSIINNENKFLEKHDVVELNYDDKKFPI